MSCPLSGLPQMRVFDFLLFMLMNSHSQTWIQYGYRYDSRRESLVQSNQRTGSEVGMNHTGSTGVENLVQSNGSSLRSRTLKESCAKILSNETINRNCQCLHKWCEMLIQSKQLGGPLKQSRDKWCETLIQSKQLGFTRSDRGCH
jgi:hypothetical protein